MEKEYLQLSKILKRLLFDKDMKPADLARALNIPPPTIHRLVTGKSTRPYESSLKPIADFFAIDVEQLLGERPLNEASTEQPFAGLSTNLIKAISVINWEDIRDLPTARLKSKRQIAVSGDINDNCFALIMHDHSMAPLFPRKTILIFDPNKKPVDRSYVLIALEEINIPIFRELLIDVDHKYLKPINPDFNIYTMRLLKENDLILACLFESRINYDPDDNIDAIEVST